MLSTESPDKFFEYYLDKNTSSLGRVGKGINMLPTP
jgi:hypothetical protein